MRGRAHEGGLTADIRHGAGLPNLVVDRLRLKQALLNLLFQRHQVHPARRHGRTVGAHQTGDGQLCC